MDPKFIPYYSIFSPSWLPLLESVTLCSLPLTPAGTELTQVEVSPEKWYLEISILFFSLASRTFVRQEKPTS